VGVAAGTQARAAADRETPRQERSPRRTRRGSRPPPQRRSSRPQPGRETERPLGLSSGADQSVARATPRGLAPRCEPRCAAWCSGYRPQRRPPQGLDALGRPLQPQRVTIRVEADIRGCCDAGTHAWGRQLLRQRLGDQQGRRRSDRRCKAGLREDGLGPATAVGTPPGARRAPRLAPVSRPAVIESWGQRRRRRHCRGAAEGYRWADDWGAGFQEQTEADDVRDPLGKRREAFQLALAPEQTR
jgi:RNA-directed DNA polymerase